MNKRSKHQMMQEAVLYGILQKLESKYLTKDRICRAILAGDRKQIQHFERMEAAEKALLE